MASYPPPSPPSPPMAPPPPKVKEEKIVLNKDQAAKGIWLVKIPKRVAEALETQRPDEKIGQVILHDQDLVTFSFDQKFTGNGLTEYKAVLRGSEKEGQAPKLVFSSDPNANCALEGTVVMEGEMTPDLSKPGQQQAYKRIINRTEARSVKKRKVIHMDDEQASAADATAAYRLYQDNLTNQKKKDTTERQIKSESEIRSLLFAYFEQKPRWQLAELHIKMGQQKSMVQSALTKIATFHKRGEFRNYWELKPEYQKRTISSEHH